MDLPIVLDCHDIIIYVGRKVAHTLNNGLGRWLNANWNGHDVVAILRIHPWVANSAKLHILEIKLEISCPFHSMIILYFSLALIEKIDVCYIVKH